MQIREVLRRKNIRNFLEAVRTEVKIFKIPEVDEIRVKGGQSIGTDGQSLELSELSDPFTCIETLEELDRKSTRLNSSH